MVFKLFKGNGFLHIFDDDGAKKPVAVVPEPLKAAPAAQPPAAKPPTAEAPARRQPSEKGLLKKLARKEAPVAVVAPAAKAASAPASALEPAEPVAGVLTTAEAIAAQRAAEQASRPVASLTTFAPANLTPGGALPRRRKRGGANLAPFRAVAASLFRK